MPRTALALIALLCSLAPAHASLTPRTQPLPGDSLLTPSLASPLPQDRPLPPDLVKAAAPRGQDDEYRITSQTEVFLDGRPCAYADVPRNASIVKMEVSAEDGIVLKIQFRSRK